MQVIIRHPRTQQEYEVSTADFRRGKHYLDPKTGEASTYEAAGFEIVSNADGTVYEPPAPREPAPESPKADKD